MNDSTSVRHSIRQELYAELTAHLRHLIQNDGYSPTYGLTVNALSTMKAKEAHLFDNQLDPRAEGPKGTIPGDARHAALPHNTFRAPEGPAEAKAEFIERQKERLAQQDAEDEAEAYPLILSGELIMSGGLVLSGEETPEQGLRRKELEDILFDYMAEDEAYGDTI